MRRAIKKTPRRLEVIFTYMMTFDRVYSWFQEQLKTYGRNTILYGDFNGVELNSSMTEDELYLTYFGKTKEEELKYREQIKKEVEEESIRMHEELEEIEKKHKEWAEKTYGSVEAYHQHLIDDLCQQGDRLIPDDLKSDWRETVTKNYEQFAVKEVLHCLEKLKDSDESVFPELKEYITKMNHSGTVAWWIFSCIGHYGGELGRKLYKYLTNANYEE